MLFISPNITHVFMRKIIIINDYIVSARNNNLHNNGVGLIYVVLLEIMQLNGIVIRHNNHLHDNGIGFIGVVLMELTQSHRILIRQSYQQSYQNVWT